MSDEKKTKWGCYLAGISTSNVAPGKLISGIKGAGERADAAKRPRVDAFPESAEKPTVADARKR
jgi:hypothetical protein